MSTQIINDAEVGRIRINSEDNGYEFQMITGNNIPVFLSCKRTIEDNKGVYVYDTSHMMSLSELAAIRPLGYSELCLLIFSLKLCQDAIADFLLSKNGLILKPEHIYYDRNKSLLQFAFFPGYDMETFTSFNALAEFLLMEIDYEDEKAVKLAYEIYAQVLNKNYELHKIVPEEDLVFTDSTVNKTENRKPNTKPNTKADSKVVARACYDTDNRADAKVRYVTDKKAVMSPNAINEYRHCHTVGTERLYDRSEHNIQHTYPRLSKLSVLCIILLVVFLLFFLMAWILCRNVLLWAFKDVRIMMVSVIFLTLLCYFPIINISDIRRSKS